MLRQALILCLCVVILSVDFCEVNEDQLNLFITKDETRRLNLNSLIKGFDLTFDSDSPQAKIYSAYEVSVNRDLNLKDYTSLKSVDMKEFDSMIGGQLTLLASKDNNQEIALWAGNFVGYEFLPDLTKFRAFTLPSGIKANCFDARSVSPNGDVILNCQSIPKTDQQDPFDIFCHINPNDTVLNFGQNCNQISSLGTSLSRKSQILKMKGKTYLLSQNKDLNQGDSSTMDYIMIYYLNQRGEMVFANVIDGSQLEEPTLSITDFLVVNNDQIVVADQAFSRLIFYSYFTYNDVKVDKVVKLNSQPQALAYRARHDTILVATQEAITEHEIEDPSIIVGKYQIDPKDNKITRLQVSGTLVAFTTNKNNLFLYERNENRINYLLDRVSFPSSNFFILSPHISFLYTFTLTKAQAVSISQPYISLSNVSADQTIQITGTSTTKQCKAKLNVKYVEDSSGIVNKQNIEDSSFKVDPTSGLTLNLKDYYGGPNLLFNTKETNPDFQVKVNQLQSLDVKASFGTAEKTSILQIDSNSFYLIGINSVKENMAYVDYCAKNNGLISCQSFWKDKNPLINTEGIPVDLIEGKIRSNGDPIIAWTYSYTHVFAYVNLRKRGIGVKIRGDVEGLPISSIKLSDTYSIMVSKAERYIQVYWQEEGISTVLDESSFTSEELQSLQQFYPREVILNPLGTGSFFVKFPTRIARFVILDSKKIKLAGIVRDYEQFILDAEWTFTYTGKNIVTIRDKQLKEEFYNPSTQQYEALHSTPFDNPNFSGLNYDSKSGLVTVNVKSDSNANEQTVKVIVPDSGAVDSQYVQMKLTGQAKVSQNWVLASSNPLKVHHLNSFPELSIQSNLPDDEYKEDISISIEIKSGSKNETSKAFIEGVNFPVAIKDRPNEKVINLPANASNLEVQLDIDSFFSGPVTDYSIQCPFCSSSQIQLETSITLGKEIKNMTEVVDYATVENYILALSNSMLFLLDSQTLEIVKMQQIPVGNCKNLVYNQFLGLFLFCISNQSPTGQIFLQYTIKNSVFDLKNAIVVDEDHLISHFDEMFISYSTPISYLMVLDNDERVDSNKKQSTIKVFSIEGDQFKFVKEWDSRDFGTETIYPINDLQITNDILFVTLGNYGMGYAGFNQGTLSDPNNIQLSAIPEIKDVMLPSSFFKQIEMLKYTQQINEISIFISSTNSLCFVANFIVDSPHLIYKSISETYNRYGRQRLLNWHHVTDNNVFLSYYNQTTELVTIVYYNRIAGVQNQFEEGVTLKLASDLVQYHEAYVSAGKLLVSHLINSPTAGSLLAYNINNGYHLLLNYDSPGNFSQINIQASNTYHTISHTQKIQFDSVPPPPPPPPPPGPDGLKWYIVVIVSAVVLLIVGVSYGLFKYMKNKRTSKNVSLLTEREEDNDADSDDLPVKESPLEQRLNKTTAEQ